MAEHLSTAGDIGRPRSQLIEEFPEVVDGARFECTRRLRNSNDSHIAPQVSLELRSMERERWWYGSEAGSNCALTKTFKAREPRSKLQVG